MAQRMLAQWQQHSAEETIYIILCVHTGMSVWLKLNKREAVRKKGFFLFEHHCVRSFSSHIKNLPCCYSALLYMPSLSPSLFYTSCWLVSRCLLPLFSFWEAPWPPHSPFCSLFLFQDISSTRFFAFLPGSKIKCHSLKNVLCVQCKNRKFRSGFCVGYLSKYTNYYDKLVKKSCKMKENQHK